MPIVERPDATLYYERHGRGPALVLAHGAGGNTLIWWHQVAHFARKYTVLTFDHRGFGRSTCAADAFHPRHFAGDLRAVLDHAGIDRAALVCQSMGGWTGLRLAIDAPERVACLVLSGSPGGLLTDAIREGMVAPPRLTGEEITPESLMLARVVAPDFPAREPERAFLYTQIAGLNAAFDLTQLVTLLEPHVHPADLEGYACPTLFLLGEHDAFYAEAALREAVDQVPGATLHLFRGSGHSPYWEMPDAFNTVAGAFVRRHWAA